MEAVALLGLVGLGYLVTKTAGAPPSQIKAKEGFQEEGNQPKTNRPKGASARGELDLMYKNSNGELYPSDPSSGPYGPPLGYATQKPVVQKGPKPQAMEATAPSIVMNPRGVEKTPDYGDGDFVVSPLTGQKVPSSEFTHNNMVPFFGGRVKQNMAIDTNTSVLDSFTGAGSTDIRKKEVETMFNTSKTPFGNPFGMEDNTDFFQTRINEPRNRAGERPFEPVRVGSAVGEKYGLTGKGGFQQFKVDEIMKKAMPTTEKLRVADNPKLTFKTPVIPGQRFILAGPDNPGEVRKYKPDTFYVDEAGERFVGAFAEESQAETARPIQVMKFVARPETSSEFMGPAASQEFGDSYVTGEYKTPMAQQHGGAGYRNADMSSYYTGNVDAEEADYGRSSIEIRPNERLTTQDRVMGLNLAPADSVQVPVHYTDDSRPTRRMETVGNIRQTGTPVGYASSAPAITVWDPSEIGRAHV